VFKEQNILQMLSSKTNNTNYMTLTVSQPSIRFFYRQTLTALDLSDNQIGNDDVEQRIRELLETNKRLN
jgi:hypothetical protein